jgi:hypothetical protein
MIGFRHVRYNANLRPMLIRAMAFFFFAWPYWALIPLFTRNQIAVALSFTAFCSAIGIGAVVGAFTLPSMKAAPGFGRHVWHGVQSRPAGGALEINDPAPARSTSNYLAQN